MEGVPLVEEVAVRLLSGYMTDGIGQKFTEFLFGGNATFKGWERLKGEAAAIAADVIAPHQGEVILLKFKRWG